MTTIIFSKTEYAVGLAWLPPSTPSLRGTPHKKKRALLAFKPPPVGYTEIDTRDGIQTTGMVYDQAQVGLVSAAAVIAKHLSTAVLIELLPDDKYWLCAVESGAVWPAGDMVGTKDQIQVRLDEVLQDMDISDGIYDATNQYELENSERIGFEDLIAEPEPYAATIQPLRKKSIIKPAMAAMALTALIGGGYISWPYLTPRTEEPIIAQITQKKTDQISRERSALAESLSVDPAVVLVQVVDVIYARPIRYAGWRQSSYEWTPEKMLAVWKREHGNYASIAAHLGDGNWTLNESTGEIIERLDHTLPASKSETSLEERLQKSNRHNLLDSLARLEGAWTIDPSTTVGKYFQVNRSTITASRLRLSSALRAAPTLRLYPIRINSIRVSIEHPLELQIVGEYYENKA